MGGCPPIALSTPVGFLPVDELDLALAILGRWGAIGHSAPPQVALPRIVSPRLVSGVDLTPVASFRLLSAVFCPVTEFSTVVTFVL